MIYDQHFVYFSRLELNLHVAAPSSIVLIDSSAKQHLFGADCRWWVDGSWMPTYQLITKPVTGLLEKSPSWQMDSGENCGSNHLLGPTTTGRQPACGG